MLVWQRSPILQKEISSNSLAGLISLWEATTRRANPSATATFQDTVTKISSYSLLVLRVPVTFFCTEMMIKQAWELNMRRLMDAFPLVLSDGQHQRQRTSKHQWGWKDFLRGQLKHWSSSVHSISSGYWYKSIFLKKCGNKLGIASVVVFQIVA